MGNLTRDPELRYTPKGTAVAKLGLAINRQWKDESGAKKEEVTFVDVDAFGRQAETLAQYLKKGRPLYIEGRLKLDTWDDKQTNQKRSKLGVVLESFQFLDSNGERQNAPKAQAASAPTGTADLPANDIDDVPFASMPRQSIERAITGIRGHKLQ